jgi:hypothetical protein
VSAVADVKLVRAPRRANREMRNCILAGGGGLSQQPDGKGKGLGEDEQWCSVVVVCSLYYCCSL